MPGIFVRTQEGALVPMASAPFASEDELQTLLASHPELLIEGRDSEDPVRYLLVAREAGIPEAEDASDRYSIDHLFVDSRGVPTLIEVKRATDTRARREVVAQMLDYAANFSRYWPPDRIREEFEKRYADRDEVEPVSLIESFSGLGYEDYWSTVKSNLAAKHLRLVFLADRIPSGLRTIIEYLNEQMGNTEVVGVEVRQHRGEGLTTLMTEVVGQTEAAKQRKSSGPRASFDWDESSFFEELARRTTPARVDVARKLMAWGVDRPDVDVTFGSGGKVGAIFFGFAGFNGRRWLQLGTKAGLGLHPTVLSRFPPFDQRDRRIEYLDKIALVTGTPLAHEIADQSYKRIATSALTGDGQLEGFIRIQEWLLSEIAAPLRPSGTNEQRDEDHVDRPEKAAPRAPRDPS